MNKRIRVLIAAAGMAALLGAAMAESHDRHGRNVSTRSRGPVETCADLEITYDYWQTARSEETRTVARSAIATLEIPTRRNSGVQVLGWDRDEYSITACKAAGARTQEAAAKLLAQVRLEVSNGRVTTPGPAEDEDWRVYLIVRAPRNGSLNLEAHNGPIGLRNVNARIRARTVNGPLSLTECSGTVEGEVQNGPINIHGGSGNYRLRAQNGPLNVRLTGTKWEGDLDASTLNGPINLEVPEDYQSGVRVDASGNSPMSCRAPQCKRALRTWENPNRIEFGSGQPVVRISTVNGPVHVE